MYLVKTEKLIATGLTEQQASVYALMIEQGSIVPPYAASKLGLTRTNTYKILDKLVELGLAERAEEKKKLVYYPTNPISLARLAAEQRNIATEREAAVQEIINELTSRYREHTEQPNIKVVTGKNKVAEAYRRQIHQKEPIYFLRSPSDIASMGFDTMHRIRTEPERFDVKRHGITPDHSTTPSRDSNLARTWIRYEDYSAQVEWSVAGENLLIIVFGEEPHAISIDSPLVADAFRQIWHVLKNCLLQMNYYSELPRPKS